MESLDLSQFYAYDGSLTTPPCWEGIRWTVLANPLPIGKNVMNLIKRNYS
jgi:carbonic anhydrase